MPSYSNDIVASIEVGGEESVTPLFRDIQLQAAETVAALKALNAEGDRAQNQPGSGSTAAFKQAQADIQALTRLREADRAASEKSAFSQIIMMDQVALRRDRERAQVQQSAASQIAALEGVARTKDIQADQMIAASGRIIAAQRAETDAARDSSTALDERAARQRTLNDLTSEYNTLVASRSSVGGNQNHEQMLQAVTDTQNQVQALHDLSRARQEDMTALQAQQDRIDGMLSKLHSLEQAETNAVDSTITAQGRKVDAQKDAEREIIASYDRIRQAARDARLEEEAILGTSVSSVKRRGSTVASDLGQLAPATGSTGQAALIGGEIAASQRAGGGNNSGLISSLRQGIQLGQEFASLQKELSGNDKSIQYTGESAAQSITKLRDDIHRAGEEADMFRGKEAGITVEMVKQRGEMSLLRREFQQLGRNAVETGEIGLDEAHKMDAELLRGIEQLKADAAAKIPKVKSTVTKNIIKDALDEAGSGGTDQSAIDAIANMAVRFIGIRREMATETKKINADIRESDLEEADVFENLGHDVMQLLGERSRAQKDFEHQVINSWQAVGRAADEAAAKEALAMKNAIGSPHPLHPSGLLGAATYGIGIPAIGALGVGAYAATGALAVGAAGAGALAAGAVGGYLASNFDQAMSQVKLIDTATGSVKKNKEEMAAWSQQVLDMSAKFGVMGTAGATALAGITSNGTRGKDAILTLNESMKLAIATGSALADSSQALGTAVEDYSLTGPQIKKAANDIAQATKLGGMDIKSYGTALESVAPQAARFGVSLKTLGALFATMVQQGKTVPQAATAIGTILQALEHPTRQQIAAAGALGTNWKALHITGGDLAGSFQRILDAASQGTPALTQIVGATGSSVSAAITMQQSLTSTDQQLAALFGGSKSAAKDFMTVMANGGKEFHTINQGMQKDSQVVSADLAKNMKTPGQVMKDILASFDRLGIELGHVFMPLGLQVAKQIKNMADALQGAIGPLGGFYDGFARWEKGVPAAIGAFLGFKTGAQASTNVLQSFSAEVEGNKNKITLHKGVLTDWYNTWLATFRNLGGVLGPFFSSLGQFLGKSKIWGQFADSVGGALRDIAGGLGGFAGKTENASKSAGDLGKMVGEYLTAALKTASGFISGFGLVLGGAIHVVTSILGPIFSLVQSFGLFSTQGRKAKGTASDLFYWVGMAGGAFAAAWLSVKLWKDVNTVLSPAIGLAQSLAAKMGLIEKSQVASKAQEGLQAKNIADNKTMIALLKDNQTAVDDLTIKWKAATTQIGLAKQAVRDETVATETAAAKTSGLVGPNGAPIATTAEKNVAKTASETAAEQALLNGGSGAAGSEASKASKGFSTMDKYLGKALKGVGLGALTTEGAAGAEGSLAGAGAGAGPLGWIALALTGILILFAELETHNKGFSNETHNIFDKLGGDFQAATKAAKDFGSEVGKAGNQIDKLGNKPAVGPAAKIGFTGRGGMTPITRKAGPSGPTSGPSPADVAEEMFFGPADVLFLSHFKGEVNASLKEANKALDGFKKNLGYLELPPSVAQTYRNWAKDIVNGGGSIESIRGKLKSLEAQAKQTGSAMDKSFVSQDAKNQAVASLEAIKSATEKAHAASLTALQKKEGKELDIYLGSGTAQQKAEAGNQLKILSAEEAGLNKQIAIQRKKLDEKVADRLVAGDKELQAMKKQDNQAYQTAESALAKKIAQENTANAKRRQADQKDIYDGINVTKAYADLALLAQKEAREKANNEEQQALNKHLMGMSQARERDRADQVRKSAQNAAEDVNNQKNINQGVAKALDDLGISGGQKIKALRGAVVTEFHGMAGDVDTASKDLQKRVEHNLNVLADNVYKHSIVPDMRKGVVKEFQQMQTDSVTAVKKMATDVESAFKTLSSSVGKEVKTIHTTLGPEFKTLGKELQKDAQDIDTGITGSFSGMRQRLNSIMKTIHSDLTGMSHQIRTGLTTDADQIATAVVGAFSTMSVHLTAIHVNLTQALTGQTKAIHKALTTEFTGMNKDAQGQFTDLLKTVKGDMDTLTKTVTTGTTAITTALSTGLKTGFTAAQTQTVTFIGQVLQDFTGTESGFQAAGAALVDAVAKGMLSQQGKAKSAGQKLGKEIAQSIQDGLSSIALSVTPGGQGGGNALFTPTQLAAKLGPQNMSGQGWFPGTSFVAHDDFQAHMDTPLRAPSLPTGDRYKLTFVGNEAQGGNTVAAEIIGPNGQVLGHWAIMHLDSFGNIGTGDIIGGGTYLGLSGNTGAHTTGPHLHVGLDKGAANIWGQEGYGFPTGFSNYNKMVTPAQYGSRATGTAGSTGGAYGGLISQYARQFGLDPRLVAAVMSVESSGRNGQTSSTGAQGLMQIEPFNDRHLGITNPWDPAQNIRGGAKLLAEDLMAAHGNIRAALSMYNSGSPTKALGYANVVLSRMGTGTGGAVGISPNDGNVRGYPIQSHNPLQGMAPIVTSSLTIPKGITQQALLSANAPHYTTDQAALTGMQSLATQIPGLIDSLKGLPPDVALAFRTQIEDLAQQWRAAVQTYNASLATENATHIQNIKAINTKWDQTEANTLAQFNIKWNANTAKAMGQVQTAYNKVPDAIDGVLKKNNLAVTKSNENYLLNLGKIHITSNKQEAGIVEQIAKQFNLKGASGEKEAQAILKAAQSAANFNTTKAVKALQDGLGISNKQAKQLFDLTIAKDEQNRTRAIDAENQGYDKHIKGIKDALKGNADSIYKAYQALAKEIKAANAPDQRFQNFQNQAQSDYNKALLKLAGIYLEPKRYPDQVIPGDTKATTTGTRKVWIDPTDKSKGKTSIPDGSTRYTQSPDQTGPSVAFQTAVKDIVDAYNREQKAANAMIKAQMTAAQVTGDWTTYLSLVSQKTSELGQKGLSGLEAALLGSGQPIQAFLDDIKKAAQQQQAMTVVQAAAQAQAGLVTGDLGALSTGLSAASVVLEQQFTAQLINTGTVNQGMLDQLEKFKQMMNQVQLATDGANAIIIAATGSLSDMASQVVRLKDDFTTQWEQALRSGSDDLSKWTTLLKQAGAAQALITHAQNLEAVVLGQINSDAGMLRQGLVGLYNEINGPLDYAIVMIGRNGLTAGQNIGQTAEASLKAADNLGTFSDTLQAVNGVISQLQEAAATEFARTGSIDPGTISAYGDGLKKSTALTADQIATNEILDRQNHNMVGYYQDLGQELPFLAQQVTNAGVQFGTSSKQYQDAVAHLRQVQAEYDALTPLIQAQGDWSKLNAQQTAAATQAVKSFNDDGLTPGEDALKSFTTIMQTGAIPSTQDLAKAEQTAAQAVADLGTAAVTTAGDLGTIITALNAFAAQMANLANLTINAQNVTVVDNNGASGGSFNRLGSSAPGFGGFNRIGGMPGGTASYTVPTLVSQQRNPDNPGQYIYVWSDGTVTTTPTYPGTGGTGSTGLPPTMVPGRTGTGDSRGTITYTGGISTGGIIGGGGSTTPPTMVSGGGGVGLTGGVNTVFGPGVIGSSSGVTALDPFSGGLPSAGTGAGTSNQGSSGSGATPLTPAEIAAIQAATTLANTVVSQFTPVVAWITQVSQGAGKNQLQASLNQMAATGVLSQATKDMLQGILDGKKTTKDAIEMAKAQIQAAMDQYAAAYSNNQQFGSAVQTFGTAVQAFGAAVGVGAATALAQAGQSTNSLATGNPGGSLGIAGSTGLPAPNPLYEAQAGAATLTGFTNGTPTAASYSLSGTPTAPPLGSYVQQASGATWTGPNRQVFQLDQYNQPMVGGPSITQGYTSSWAFLAAYYGTGDLTRSQSIVGGAPLPYGGTTGVGATINTQTGKYVAGTGVVLSSAQIYWNQQVDGGILSNPLAHYIAPGQFILSDYFRPDTNTADADYATGLGGVFASGYHSTYNGQAVQVHNTDASAATEQSTGLPLTTAADLTYGASQFTTSLAYGYTPAGGYTSTGGSSGFSAPMVTNPTPSGTTLGSPLSSGSSTATGSGGGTGYQNDPIYQKLQAMLDALNKIEQNTGSAADSLANHDDIVAWLRELYELEKANAGRQIGPPTDFADWVSALGIAGVAALAGGSLQ